MVNVGRIHHNYTINNRHTNIRPNWNPELTMNTNDMAIKNKNVYMPQAHARNIILFDKNSNGY